MLAPEASAPRFSVGPSAPRFGNGSLEYFAASRAWLSGSY